MPVGAEVLGAITFYPFTEHYPVNGMLVERLHDRL